jgi:hypothetical protein
MGHAKVGPRETAGGASERAGPRKKSCKPQKTFVEVFLTARPLSIWRGVHAPETMAVPSSSINGRRQQKEACCAAVSRENPVGVSEEGKNCSLHFSFL